MEAEEFLQTSALLAAADPALLFRVLCRFGFDYWLQQLAYATPVNPKTSPHFSTSLIERFKQFVEVDFCQSQQGIQGLAPYQLRLLSKTANRGTAKGQQQAKAEQPDDQAKAERP